MFDYASYSPKLIERCLILIKTKWETKGVIRYLDTKLVLAEAWNNTRLENCRELYKQGKKAPPISVVGFKLGNRSVYSVSDGNHRIIVCREMGKKVKADVAGIYTCDPQAFVIIKDVLWQKDGDSLIGIDYISEEEEEVLTKLGVESKRN